METLLINGGKLKPGIKGIAFQLLHSTIHAGVAYLFVAEWTCWIIPAVIFVRGKKRCVSKFGRSENI